MVGSRPLVVGIGGTVQPGSSTEQASNLALSSAEKAGGRVVLLDGALLTQLPHFGTEQSRASEEGRVLIDAVREADGLMVAAPGYHGSASGLAKNAIDYLEDTAKDDRTYLDGVPVGLIATTHGWQATASTLATMRSIVHALRGWLTPLRAAIESAGGAFRDGKCTDPSVGKQLDIVRHQVVEFAKLRLGGAGRSQVGTNIPASAGFLSG